MTRWFTYEAVIRKAPGVGWHWRVESTMHEPGHPTLSPLARGEHWCLTRAGAERAARRSLERFQRRQQQEAQPWEHVTGLVDSQSARRAVKEAIERHLRDGGSFS